MRITRLVTPAPPRVAHTGSSVRNREFRVPAVDHAPPREALERATFHKITTAFGNVVKVDVRREVVGVGATGSLAHRRPFGIARFQHLDQAIDAALGPADAEGLPIGPDRWDPVIGNDHGHRARSERLVEPDRGRGVAPGAQYKTGAWEHGLESRSPLIEAFGHWIPESEPVDLLDDRVWVLEREQRATACR